MTPRWCWSPAAVKQTWDARADLYLGLFRDELESKPFDKEVLARFAARAGDGSRVLDVGCGPCGHVAALLVRLGLETISIDLSPRCIELARCEQPDLRFEVMDLAEMSFEASSFGGLVAYYALHDQPRSRLARTFSEFARVLRPGGRLLVVAKEGSGEGLIPDPMGSEIRWPTNRRFGGSTWRLPAVAEIRTIVLRELELHRVGLDGMGVICRATGRRVEAE